MIIENQVNFKYHLISISALLDGQSMENFDADEKTSLLKAEGGSVQHTPSFHSLPVLGPPQKQMSRPASVLQSPLEDTTEEGKSLLHFHSLHVLGPPHKEMSHPPVFYRALARTH